MPPPPAEPFASRIFLGPALRTQPDRRLVTLVREGYDGAFEEIVRRYRKPLDRFAAAFVGNRCEDVTQDAFSKALLALRGSEKEIELRPWLYRIVRNTALTDLRDGPPAAAELAEEMATGPSAAAEAGRREEVAELMARLRALPEPQRAAIVMRELEGLSHEEIAAGLGISGGAARQTIYRARAALRDGFGMLVPLPLLRMLFDQGAEAAAGGGAAGGAAAAAGAAAASGGGGAAGLGGIGAAGALKAGLATAVLAGSIGAGVAVQHHRSERPSAAVAETAAPAAGPADRRAESAAPGTSDLAGDREGDEDGHRDGGRHGHGPGSERHDEGGRAADGGGTPHGDGPRLGEGDDSGGPGHGSSGSGSGRGGGGGDRGGSGGGPGSGSGSSGRDSGSGSGGSGSGSSGGDGSGGSGGSGSGSAGGPGSSGPDSSGGGSGSDGGDQNDGRADARSPRPRARSRRVRQLGIERLGRLGRRILRRLRFRRLRRAGAGFVIFAFRSG